MLFLSSASWARQTAPKNCKDTAELSFVQASGHVRGYKEEGAITTIST